MGCLLRWVPGKLRVEGSGPRLERRQLGSQVPLLVPEFPIPECRVQEPQLRELVRQALRGMRHFADACLATTH